MDGQVNKSTLDFGNQVQTPYIFILFHFDLKTPAFNLKNLRPKFRPILNSRPLSTFPSNNNINSCENAIIPFR